MKTRVSIINPIPNLKKGSKKMAAKRRHHKKHNAATVKHSNVHHRKHYTTKIHHRKHSNPDGIPASFAPDKMNNVLHYGGGILAGSLGVPIITNMIGGTGYTKYLVSGGITVAGYMALKKVAPKLALALLISGLTVTAGYIEKDYNLISGAEKLLGLSTPFSPTDVNRMRDFANQIRTARLLGMVPNRPGLNGMVPNRGIALSRQPAVSGFDNNPF